MRVSIRAAVLLALTFSATIAFARPKALELLVRPLFQGYCSGNSLVPMLVEVRNNASDARGVVRVNINGYRMDYPVELPSNSDKTVVVYAEISNSYGEDCTVDLLTNQGSEHATFDPSLFVRTSMFSILEIGGTIGELNFLDQSLAKDSPGREPMWTSAYVKPEDAPERLAAYSGIKVIVLGSGSERLSDGAVKALKLYVMSNGTLIVPGGVASPLFADKRWLDAMPVKVGSPHMVSSSAWLKRVGGTPVDQPFSVMDFEPVAGAKVEPGGGEKLIAARQFGLGTIEFIAFSPFDGGLRTWEGRSALFRKLLAQNSRLGDPMQDLIRGSSSSGYPYDDESTGPFQLDLPEASTIGLLLIGYILVVVPVNFLVLHKLKRRELAWVTAPAISVVFAGLIIKQGGALYGISTSVNNQALLVAQQEYPSGVVAGHAQVFFSQSGTYDLKLNGIDSVKTGSQPDYMYRPDRTKHDLSELAPLDTGQVTMASANPGNLSFNEFDYQQVASPELLAVRFEGNEVVVNAKTDIANATLIAPEGSYDLGDIKAGQAKRQTRVGAHPNQKLDEPSNNDQQYYGRYDARPAFDISNLAKIVAAGLQGEVAVLGSASGLTVGPQVGKQVGRPTSFVFFARDLR